MRAKFLCDSVMSYPGSQEAALSPVVSTDNLEDQDFNDATPSGSLIMLISNPKAQTYFKPGKSYYLDFTEAE